MVRITHELEMDDLKEILSDLLKSEGYDVLKIKALSSTQGRYGEEFREFCALDVKVSSRKKTRVRE